MKDLKTKLDKIDTLIAIGLKQRAAQRLHSLVGHYPDEAEIWHKLAEMYYDSGFYDAAGKYWIFTEPTEKRISKCVELYEKSVNHSGNQILTELVYRGDRTKLSEYGKKKLEALEADSKLKTGVVPEFGRNRLEPKKSVPVPELTLKQKITEKAIYGFILCILFLMVLGVVNGITVLWHYLL